ncbi:Cilia- and flagella-associated protein 47 [Phytophthora pseudosyringae]|uniref:Cilia- and flagella-associated protein 47 n=1 Tax=Phytophthora pseudosyringae TaxID=221518 RepID=A0A8T1VQ58_9STRA|nr:Cilia- and flagella-associated protein 47 [Phytophthora pseudosyringae]
MPTSAAVNRPSTPCGLRGDRAASALQVAPSAIEFAAFERGSCYVATLNVRNASDRVLRFRLAPPPHASPFKVLLRGRDLARTENATVTLPAGLGTKYEITFEQPGGGGEPHPDDEAESEADATPAIVHDALQLRGDDGSSLEVPLMARRAGPLLDVSPALCELGLVVLTQRSARFIEVLNCGARPGKFAIEVLDAGGPTNGTAASRAAVAISPQRGRLAPQESVNVKVEAHGLETGAFRGIVRVRIWAFVRGQDGEDEEDEHGSSRVPASGTGPPPAAEKIVDVSGNVVEHTAELVLRQGLEPVRSLFFGSLFAGETRTIETLLRNNGPQPLTFKTSITFGGGAAAAGLEEDREAYERRKELRITPADGCMDPFSEAVVTFTYHPQAKLTEEIQRIERKQGGTSPEDGDYAASSGSSSSLDSSSPFLLLPGPAQPLSAFASIVCEDLQAQNLTFEVSAKTFVPRLELSPTPPLDFGDVRSYDRADILLSLKNLSGLPVRFEAPKDVAHYSVSPRTGRLDVLQSQSLVVSFAPTQLGTFNSILALRINDGVLEIPVKVLGRAAVVGPVPPVAERLVGGPMALPADFAPKYKFLLPEEAKETKGKLSRRFHRQPPHELAALNGTAALDEFEFQGTNNTHLTYCVKELARRADHRAAYHDYLAQSRAQREAKAKGWKGKAQGLKKSVAQARGNNQEEEDGVPNNEDVDLGMRRESRPQPQELRLPRSLATPSEPLWLSQHSAGGKAGQSKVFFDEFKLIKKKFKSAPATPAELADCSRTLEFHELEQVVSGPKTLNFGRLSVNGSATRSLTVQNNLQHNILVTLGFGGGGSTAQKDGAAGPLEELARKTPLTSQVVPPCSKAGFDLVFSSSREQFFQQAITYSLNGVHPRQATIVAEVAPIVVDLAPEDLRFDFGALDLSSAVARDVVITNTCDSEAPFAWTRLPLLATPDSSTRPDSSKSNATTTVTTMTMGDKAGSNSNTAMLPVFEVVPASGTLGPSATMVCKVVYAPPSMTAATLSALGISSKSGAMWLAQMFQLDVTGGEKGILNCRALLPDVKVVAREKKVDFGTISVGVERDKRITLSNLGMHSRAVFYASVEPPSMSTTIGLQVTPAQGVVDPQESVEITVKLLPHRAIALDGTSGAHQVNIVVALRGGKVLRLPVSASVLVPDVFLAPVDAIDFGEVVLGVSVPRVISLENHSSIPASLLLDLGAAAFSGEFALATPPRLLAHLEDASNIFVPLTDIDRHRDVGNTQDGEEDGDEGLAPSDARCLKWQICLPPHATVSCHLVFTPLKEGSHDLVLPLQIAGVGATAASSGPAPLKRRVLARAIVPRLRFSSSTMHFNRCVITREGIRKVPYTKQLVLTNDDEQPVPWQIDTARLRRGNLVTFAAGAAAVTLAAGAGSSGSTLAKRIASANPTNSATAVVFHVAPDRGELAPGEDVTVRVSFLPLDAVEYAEDELPLLVDGEAYVNLSLRGEGIHPHLSFSTNRVVLPTVPLGVTASANFHVYATGYDHLELACRVPLDTARAPLTVLFPRGKTLSMACPSLPVELRFSSTASVAFNARLEFFDADGNSFSLAVAGCAENCLLTNYSFLQTQGLAVERLVDDSSGSPRSTQQRKELPRSGLEADNTSKPTGEHPGSASSKSFESEGKPTNGLQFYTHASGRFPVYLLSTRQAQAELEKHKDSQVSSTQHTTANGFVVVDPSTGSEEDDSALSAPSTALLTLQTPSGVPFSEGEIQLVMQYLSANFLRTAVVRFPEDFADDAGRPLYELLDMICVKKPGGLAVPSVRGAGGGNTNSKRKHAEATNSTSAGGKANGSTAASSSAPPPSKKDQLTQLTAQYVELLKFLRSYGAMVHDVFPEHLLAQEFYLRACESPQVDPALLSSPSYATLPFVARRRALKNEWRAVSTAAWMKVIYQVIKCFLLARITWKGYQMQLQGENEPASGETSARNDKRKGEKHASSTGRACQGSNLYSEAEMVLIQWLCDRVRSLHQPQHPAAAPLASLGGALLETQLLDIGRDLRDGRWLFHLVAAHIPTLSMDQSAYHCFRWMPEATSSRVRRPPSAAQLQHQAAVLLQTLGAFGLDFGLDAARFLRRYTGREILVLLLHLQQTLPQFIPKATIEFRGGLGQVMEKSIELKNPSARPLRYHVFLDGAGRTSAGFGSGGAAGPDVGATASEFTVESNELVLDPGKTIAFAVTFRPRFSRKVTARLVFQAARGDIAGATSVGGGGATMVFLLESSIVSRKPVRIIQLETRTYEKRTEEIVIENQFPANATFKLSMTQQQQTPPSGAEAAAGMTTLGSSAVATGVLPSSRGGARRRTVQAVGNQGGPSTSSFGMSSDVASFGGKRMSISGKTRGEDGDFSWCVGAQQPFYLPDFGTSGSTNSGGDDASSAEGGSALSVPASGLSGVSVAIRKNGSAKVKLEFLPLVPGNYRCQLLFLDETIGEFLYEIHAVAHLPASLETLEIQCEASTAASGAAAGPGAARFRFVRELTIPVKNPLLSRALTTFVERASGYLRAKLKDGLKRCEENHHTSFHVDFNSPYFTANVPELTLSTGTSKPVPASGRSDGSGIESSGPKVPLKANQARLGTPRSVLAGTNSVLIDFQPKGAGRYACKLLLRSRNSVCGSSDLRVYDLDAKVKEPNVKTQLEFVAPARHSIVQEIPLSNPTDTTWSLKAIFSGGGNTASAGNARPPASMFSGPPALVVPAKRSATYPLTFTPSWIHHETRTFVLLNTATQQQFEFELSGYGEEPLAQDHVALTCQARSSIVHHFDVFALPGGNGSGDANAEQTFNVESDLRDVVGASTITVPPTGAGGSNRIAKYPLTFSPLVSGSYFGSVTFTNAATNEFLWYTVEASVSPPEPETTLEMRAPVRGAVGVEIGLANPLDDETTFTVELRGRGLLGPTTFALGARQSGVYELVYSPLLVTAGNGEEGAILFSSDAVGQFWYRLNLVAEAAAAQELDDMTCAVGDVCTQPLWLQNPSNLELQLQYRISNARNFSIKGATSSSVKTPMRVLLPPFGRASVVVEYTPSSLSDFESTSIVFYEKDVASDWGFTVRGRGRAPSVMKPLVVTARVSEAASTLFTFKNPFAAPLRVDVKLVAEASENSPPASPRGATRAPVFDMLLKKRRVLLESFGLLQVPISFLPHAVSESRAELVVHGGDEYAELEWRYPLRGVAEAPLHPRVLAVLACQARDSVEKRVECELLAAPDDMVLANETFTLEWEVDAGRFGPMATASAIERALTVTPLPVPSASGSTCILPYTIRFEPLRPHRGSVALLVKKNSGGLWRFDVSLDAGDPPVDDVLSIESSLNQTSSVSFQLRNQFRQPAAFLAEFSAGSSSAFTVYPAEGELPPFGSEDGAVFVVSFTPTGYGKMQSGQLVICTEEMQWTFNVKGVYPDATPGGRTSGPVSSLSLSSSASRARLGIANSGSEPGSSGDQRVDRARGRSTRSRQ